MATEKYKRLTCAHCKVDFLSDRKKQHCSQRCAEMRRARERGVRPKAEDAASRRNPAHVFTCEHCGREAHRRPSATMLALGYPNRWCSMACRVGQSMERAAAERKDNERRQAQRHLVRALKRLIEERAPEPACQCATCGNQFDRRPNHRHDRCAGCALEIARAKRAAYRVTYAKTPRMKAARLKAKAIRRAKQKIDADVINPIKVFERDRWRCQLCGGATPKRLRGSYDLKAPELDHVVPLSLGGGHTWANVQCACRRCNLEKGAKPLGQIGLGFAV